MDLNVRSDSMKKDILNFDQESKVSGGSSSEANTGSAESRDKLSNDMKPIEPINSVAAQGPLYPGMCCKYGGPNIIRRKNKLDFSTKGKCDEK